VLITQTHGTLDAGAAALARWLRGACTYDGLDAFYEEGISATLSLKAKQRRLLRDAFESSRCVAAAAVSGAVSVATDGAVTLSPPLSNEVVWAEQHGRPIVIVYDAARPFAREEWQERWPDLFRKGSLVRYYGKGHEECRAGVLEALHEAMAPSVCIASSQAASAPFGSATPPETRAPRDEDGSHVGDVASSVSAVASAPCSDLEASLAVLAAAQAAAAPELEPIAARGGILRQRGSSAALLPQRGSRARFTPTEQNVRLATQGVMTGLEAPGISVFTVFDCLKLGLGVSEQVVAKALHILSCQLHALSADGMVGHITDLAFVALRRHSDSVDACTSALEVLTSVQSSIPDVWLDSKRVSIVAGALLGYPGCHALQRHGFRLLAHDLVGQQQKELEKEGEEEDAGGGRARFQANHREGDGAVFALRGGGMARILTRAGVSDLALQALQRHQRSGELVQDVCTVLQRLATASPEVKSQVVSQHAQELWMTLLTKAELGSVSVTGALRVLASLVTDDATTKETVGRMPGLFDVLERRLRQSPGNSGSSGDRAEEATEVFGLLCRLTARHADNKRRCLATHLPKCAVQQCRDCEAPDMVRLAAGGLLVNLGGGSVLVVGARPAASALCGAASPDLRRCGEALQDMLLMEGRSEGDDSPALQPGVTAIVRADLRNAAAPQANGAQGSGSVFDGLFAVRRSSAAGSESGATAASATSTRGARQTSQEIPKGARVGAGAQKHRSSAGSRGHSEAAKGSSASHNSADNARSFATREKRGPGWQRRPGGHAKEETLRDGSSSEAESSIDQWAAEEPTEPPGPWDYPVTEVAGAGEFQLDLLNLSTDGPGGPAEGEISSPPPEFVSDDGSASPSEAVEGSGGGRGMTRPARPPSGGLKGNDGVRRKLAEMRAQGTAEDAQKRHRFPFGLGRQAVTKTSKYATPPRDYYVVDREREQHLASLAVSASRGNTAAAGAGAGSSPEQID